MISQETKNKIDQASEDELWRMLASGDDTAQAFYIREKLAHRAQVETRREIKDLTARLQQMEQSLERPALATPTFWMALLAALFASFAVPWDEVEERAKEWQTKAEKALAAPRIKRPSQDIRRTISEPSIPATEDTSPMLSDALLLLPRVDARPRQL